MILRQWISIGDLLGQPRDVLGAILGCLRAILSRPEGILDETDECQFFNDSTMNLANLASVDYHLLRSVGPFSSTVSHHRHVFFSIYFHLCIFSEVLILHKFAGPTAQGVSDLACPWERKERSICDILVSLDHPSVSLDSQG